MLVSGASGSGFESQARRFFRSHDVGFFRSTEACMRHTVLDLSEEIDTVLYLYDDLPGSLVVSLLQLLLT